VFESEPNKLVEWWMKLTASEAGGWGSCRRMDVMWEKLIWMWWDYGLWGGLCKFDLLGLH